MRPTGFTNLFITLNLDGQLHFFTLPELKILAIPPIRNVYAIAMDQQALSRPLLHAPVHTVEAVDFCVIKKTALGLFSLREKLVFHKVSHIQSHPGSVSDKSNRISLWLIVGPAHGERGPYFVSPTRRISIFSISGEEHCCL